MYPDTDEQLNYATEETIYFFTPAFHPLDNFSAHAIEVWGVLFPTVEHAYQWKKFSLIRPDIAQQILLARSPDAVKKISDPNISNQPEDWHERRVSIMEEILRVKAEQHEDVREILKKTETRRIIENSPIDNFFGGGPDGNGKNIVGELWMKIRDELSTNID